MARVRPGGERSASRGDRPRERVVGAGGGWRVGCGRPARAARRLRRFLHGARQRRAGRAGARRARGAWHHRPRDGGRRATAQRLPSISTKRASARSRRSAASSTRGATTRASRGTSSRGATPCTCAPVTPTRCSWPGVRVSSLRPRGSCRCCGRRRCELDALVSSGKDEAERYQPGQLDPEPRARRDDVRRARRVGAAGRTVLRGAASGSTPPTRTARATASLRVLHSALAAGLRGSTRSTSPRAAAPGPSPGPESMRRRSVAVHNSAHGRCGRRGCEVGESGVRWGPVGDRQPRPRHVLRRTYEHTIDEKSRLTLPAKFRDGLGGGVVLVRGYRRARSTSIRARAGSRASSGSPLSTRSRGRRARCSASSSRAQPWPRLDKQGRVLVPPELARHAGLGGTSSVVGVYDHIEIWGRPAWADARQRHRRERRRCCRTSCSGQTRLITSPCSRTRCASSSTCSRGRRSSMPPSARAATRALLAADLQGSGKLVAIDRDPTVRPYFDRVQGGGARRAGALSPRRLRRRPVAARRRTACAPTRCCSTSASVVDAGRSTRARLLVRDRRAARHAHGPVGRAQRGRRASTTYDERELETIFRPLRRGAIRATDRARRSCAAARRRRSSGRASSSTSFAPRYRLRRDSARDIPPSACSRRCGSR